jgi:septum formation protein|tara:strand:- start:961 stop:1548 length:588 start_codon:yes stop_codon:yes gene_type:complete
VPLCLASASPRRQALLNQIEVPFTILVVDLDETRLLDEPANQMVARLARSKATTAKTWFVEHGKPVPAILGADTCVVIDKEVLGKPGSRREAVCMLHKLSGRTHQVYTGIALLSGPTIQTQTVMSEVTFTQLTSVRIENYCDGTEPFDKAGAYAIQGVGATFISHISGSYSNIMGLPLHETYALLTEARLVWVIK